MVRTDGFNRNVHSRNPCDAFAEVCDSYVPAVGDHIFYL